MLAEPAQPSRALIVAAGYSTHFIGGSIDGAAVFLADDDRRMFLEWLAVVAAEEGAEVHAYILGTNRLHPRGTSAEHEGVSAVMKLVAQRYIQHVKRIDQYTGALFEGRFRSSLIARQRGRVAYAAL